ncbi:MAG TPA: hypothetical protein PK551_10705 [Anaerolineales bacterium]|nr:hypothetical protein [Anaerolineales bacterium]
MKMKQWGALFLTSLWLVACAATPAAEPDSNLLYFTHRMDADSSLLAPGHLRQTLGAQATGEWGDLMQLHTAQPAAAVLIDGAAAEHADADDLARLYRQCVVLVFFNLYAPDVAALVNAPSLLANGWMDGSDPYAGDFYILLHRRASGSQGDCSGAGPSGSPGATGGLSQGGSQGQLSTQAEFDTFEQVLTLELAQP